MSRNSATRSFPSYARSYRPSRVGDLIGYTRAGRPIFLPGGGAPDDDGTGADPPATPAPPGEPDPPPYAFPFAVPREFTGSSGADLEALLDQVRDHARQLAALPPDQVNAGTLAALRACRDLANDIRAEQTTRASLVDEAGGLAAEMEDV